MLRSELTVISCPRNFQTPRSSVPEVNVDVGIEKPEVPGANISGGTASPVTDSIWLSEVELSGTVSGSSVRLVDEKYTCSVPSMRMRHGSSVEVMSRCASIVTGLRADRAPPVSRIGSKEIAASPVDIV